MAGTVGRAVKFDGSTVLDAGADVGDFERTDKFSYGAWVLPESAGDGLTIVARMDDANASRGHDLILANGKPEAHVVNVWPGNAIRVIAKKPLAAGKWHHVFVTYDGSSKVAGLKLYVDGAPIEVEATHDTLTATTKTAVPLHIGKRSDSISLKAQDPPVGAVFEIWQGPTATPPGPCTVMVTGPLGATEVSRALLKVTSRVSPSPRYAYRLWVCRIISPGGLLSAATGRGSALACPPLVPVATTSTAAASQLTVRTDRVM